MHIYDVSIAHVGREKDYSLFWDKDEKVNSNGEELHPGLVGFNERVEAKNLREAIKMAKKKFPSNYIVEKHSSKVD